jgi:hypothetical protein
MSKSLVSFALLAVVAGASAACVGSTSSEEPVDEEVEGTGDEAIDGQKGGAKSPGWTDRRKSPGWTDR